MLLGFFLISFEIRALKLQGNYIQGGIVFGKIIEEAKVYFDDKVIPIDKSGNFIFGFQRNYGDFANLKVVYDNGKTFKK